MNSRERIKMVYKLAKTRDRRSKYISDMPFFISLEGQILTEGSDIILRWQTYFDGLLNTENPRKPIQNGLLTEGPIELFNENEVSKQLGKMGLDKAIGANGGAEKDASNTIQIPWSKGRDTTGVMCDRKIPTKLIEKVYKTAIKPVMAYYCRMWAVRKKDRKFHTSEMRMFRWARG